MTVGLQNPSIELSLIETRPQRVQVWGKRGFQSIVLDMLNVRCEFRQPNGYGKLAIEGQ